MQSVNVNFQEQDSRLEETIKSNKDGAVSFGINYLDDSLGGILPSDFVVVAGYTGGGKTEMCIHTALHVAKQNQSKEVFFFALEASKNEIYLRCLYKEITRLHFLDSEKNKSEFNYQSWITGGSDFLNKYLDTARSELRKIKNLRVIYGGEFYTLEKFKIDMMGISSRDVSLVVVDHLHYFDIEGSNENSEIYKIVKEMRALFLEKEIPLVLVSHVRKKDSKTLSLTPSSDDLHGTSNIAKVSTKIITLAGAFDTLLIDSDGNLRSTQLGKGLGTFIKIAKNRLGQHAGGLYAFVKFNSLKNDYSKNYTLGTTVVEDKKLVYKELSRMDIPFWAKGEVWNQRQK